MFTSNEHGIKKQAQVDFTRSGWRQFIRLNRSMGALAAYLTAHEAAGAELDEGCQEVCYENGVYLLLRRMQGVWYITDIWVDDDAIAFDPVWIWQQIKRGADYILAHILSGWRQLTERMAASI